jgi:hypothetical protein
VDNLEKLRDGVVTLYSKKVMMRWTKTSDAELESLAADNLAMAALVYQELKQATRSGENRSWRRV